jgi:hypothetical protein
MKIKHALAASIAVFALAACEVPEDDGTTAADRAEVNSTHHKSDKAAKAAKAADADDKPAAPKETKAQENARESAESYLDLSAHSRSGLIKQLKFEGFSEKDATYGVDAQHADWKKQAAASAEAYLDMSAFSRSGLIQQLMFEGYTREQATYGANKIGL